MAMSLAFHIIFAAVGTGMPLLMAIAEGLHVWHPEAIYLAVGAVVLFPALGYLFYVFKRRQTPSSVLPLRKGRTGKQRYAADSRCTPRRAPRSRFSEHARRRPRMESPEWLGRWNAGH